MHAAYGKAHRPGQAGTASGCPYWSGLWFWLTDPVSGKFEATAIYIAFFALGWWFFQSRIAILGRTDYARRRALRNSVLLGGMFLILIINTWVPSSDRHAIDGIGVLIVVATYLASMGLEIRRARAARTPSKPN